MEFVDLKKQYQLYKEGIQHKINLVLESARFINGPVIGELEEKLARYAGAGHAICCSSGTDALIIALMALGIQPGDEVIVPDFTFIATAEAVALLGAVPVFVDVEEETFNIDPKVLEKNITEKTRGIIAVSLFGQCADFDAINRLGRNNGLWVIEDAAQSFGAEYNGKKSCGLTYVATTSFFPAKPLGCYGDGGAVFTKNEELADKMRIILNHGQDKRYHHSVLGINGRLDSLQAAVLLVKLDHFEEEMKARRKAAARYTELLAEAVKTPAVRKGATSVWAQYTVRHPKRDALREALQESGIPTAVHYPVPLHQQKVFSDSSVSCPMTERLSKEVFSLPMHPFLTKGDIDFICKALMKAAL